MSRKAQPSEANHRLNARINDRNKQQRANPNADGSATFVLGSKDTNRGKIAVSADFESKGDNVGTEWQVSKSKFAILAYNNDNGASELKILKHKIRNLPSGPSSGAHEKGQIKLERVKGQKEEKMY